MIEYVGLGSDSAGKNRRQTHILYHFGPKWLRQSLKISGQRVHTRTKEAREQVDLPYPIDRIYLMRNRISEP